MRGSVCQYMHLVAMLFGRKGMKFLVWQGAKLCMYGGHIARGYYQVTRGYYGTVPTWATTVPVNLWWFAQFRIWYNGATVSSSQV